MATQDSPTKNRQTMKLMQTIGRRFTVGLGTRLVRWVIITAALAYLGWVLFGSVWQPLHQPVLLPAGVSSANPEVNNELLQTITSARVERSQYTTKSLFAFEPLFAPSVSPQPTPVR